MIWKNVLENIHFGRVVVWYGLNWMIIHFFKVFNPQRSLYSIHPFLLNHPVGKYLVRQGIESIPSSKQQRRPLPSLLSLSFFYAVGKVFILFSNTLGSGGDRDYDDANYPNLWAAGWWRWWWWYYQRGWWRRRRSYCHQVKELLGQNAKICLEFESLDLL